MSASLMPEREATCSLDLPPQPCYHSPMPIKITHRTSLMKHLGHLDPGTKFALKQDPEAEQFMVLAQSELDNSYLPPFATRTTTTLIPVVSLKTGLTVSMSRLDDVCLVSNSPPPSLTPRELVTGTYVMNQGKVYLVDSDGWVVDLMTGINYSPKNLDDPNFTMFTGTIEVTK